MKLTIYIALFILLLSACTEKMDINLGSTYTRLSVEGKVTSDNIRHYVRLTESSDVFFNEPAAKVSNAVVQVSDGDNTYNYSETEPGYYKSDIRFSGVPGKTYRLKISNIDIDKDGTAEEYFASETMLDFHTVDSIKMHFDPSYDNYEDDEGPFWFVSIFLTDDIATDDFYGFASRINNQLVHDTITEVLVVEDTYFNGGNSKGVDVVELNQDKTGETVMANDTITLETYSITEKYYDFVSEFQQMDDSQLPLFSGPPANITTNLNNKAIGYFAVYPITRISGIIRE